LTADARYRLSHELGSEPSSRDNLPKYTVPPWHGLRRLGGERVDLVDATGTPLPPRPSIPDPLTPTRSNFPSNTLRRMIYAYPTVHRASEDALRDLADG